MHHSCPACAAPLDADGICPSCGALSRGFFRGLDLGAPQIADAVRRGLDFYRLLEVPEAADLRAIARRYRQLRVHFPDDPSHLRPEPARRLALLEVAGRVLTDPALRQIYDQMRQAEAHSSLELGVVRCPSCTAPFAAQASHCQYCGTPRPAEAQPPAAPPIQPAAEVNPVDFYALLGLAAPHLVDTPALLAQPQVSLFRPTRRRGLFDWFDDDQDESHATMAHLLTPPDEEQVDAAARELQRRVLLAPGMSPEVRQAQDDQLEVARRILRDDRRRYLYDSLLKAIRQGKLGDGRLDAFHALEQEVRAEMAAERGEAAQLDGYALLQQGVGLLKMNLPRDAVPKLRLALQALPDHGPAHAALAQALLSQGDPLDLGGFALHELQVALEHAQRDGAALPDGEGLITLCQALQARDRGEPAVAEAGFAQAVRENPGLAAAWRGLAASALQRRAFEEVLHAGRQALTINPDDERALLLMLGACVRGRMESSAYELAARIAEVRGEAWDAEQVLAEVRG